MAKKRATGPITTTYKIVIDSREQLPYTFKGFEADADEHNRPLDIQTVVGTVPWGDYTLVGHEHEIAIERKSMADWFSTLGQDRERFINELEALASYKFACVVIEADWRSVLRRWPKELKDLLHYLHMADMLAPSVVQARPEPLDQDSDDPLACPIATIQAPQFGAWAMALSSIMQETQSKLNVKTIFRSVISWEQRYPHVHFQLMGDRVTAEVYTFRALQRFWNDLEEGKKLRCPYSTGIKP